MRFCQIGVNAESLTFGAPAKLYLEYTFPQEAARIDICLHCFEKAAARLPVAFWLSFIRLHLKAEVWRLEKMGQMISPLVVVSKGARSLHAIDRGCFY
jgi:hypothetical protein